MSRSKSASTKKSKIVSRRVILSGVGGAALGLPFLEGFRPNRAEAQSPLTETFAVFFRQANGVAAAQDTRELGSEPERFWPTEVGPLTEETVRGRALEELNEHLPRILAAKNVHMEPFDFGDGHARGALQGLTAQGPVVEGVAGSSEANGESLDHRIGRELNDDGRDSLFLYAGSPNGWLGGPCISYRGPENRRSAINEPWSAYQSMIGGATGLSPEAVDQLLTRNRSVNDLVRSQLGSLLSRTDLSSRDRQRLDLHLSSLRDLEKSLSCQMLEDDEMALSGLGPSHASTDGDLVLQTARAHMGVVSLAIACGYTRSAAIQVGNGNDGLTQYRDENGDLMENYHYISHRRLSHDAEGAIIAGSDLLHHHIDRQFAQTFKYLIDRLSAYDLGGESLLDQGAAIWYNDLGNGPSHSPNSAPVIIAGSCGGYFKQGECVEVDESGYDAPRNHARVLNTIATAVGCRTDGEDICQDHGDPGLDRTPHPALQA